MNFHSLSCRQEKLCSLSGSPTKLVKYGVGEHRETGGASEYNFAAADNQPVDENTCSNRAWRAEESIIGYAILPVGPSAQIRSGLNIERSDLPQRRFSYCPTSNQLSFLRQRSVLTAPKCPEAHYWSTAPEGWHITGLSQREPQGANGVNTSGRVRDPQRPRQSCFHGSEPHPMHRSRGCYSIPAEVVRTDDNQG